MLLEKSGIKFYLYLLTKEEIEDCISRWKNKDSKIIPGTPERYSLKAVFGIRKIVYVDKKNIY